MYQPNEILENRLPSGSVVVVRVVEMLDNGMARVADVRDWTFEMTPSALIEADLTWACPVENLYDHPADCQVCHKDGLVWMG